MDEIQTLIIHLLDADQSAQRGATGDNIPQATDGMPTLHLCKSTGNESAKTMRHNIDDGIRGNGDPGQLWICLLGEYRCQRVGVLERAPLGLPRLVCLIFVILDVRLIQRGFQVGEITVIPRPTDQYHQIRWVTHGHGQRNRR